jgi:hypothetical protein
MGFVLVLLAALVFALHNKPKNPRDTSKGDGRSSS